MPPTEQFDRVTSLVDRTATRWGPAVLRWTAALLWLGNVSWKRPPDFGRTSSSCRALCNYVQHGIDHPVLPGSAWLFEHLISPHLWAFGWLTILGEGTVGALLAAGRFRRTAAATGIALSVGILAAVANAPGEWYWAYLLMIALHLAVIVATPASPPAPAKSMAIATMIFGAAIALVHIGEGATGTKFTVFAGGGPLPGDLARNLLSGSVVLGIGLAFAGFVAFIVARQAPVSAARLVGAAAIAVAFLTFLTYDSDGTIIGLGSSTTTACVLGALGLALAVPASATDTAIESDRRT